MPVVENPDGTLWLDVDDLSEVDAVRACLTKLGVRATALVPDTSCETAVEEVSWSELYPQIVPRNGPEPGIIVQPAAIPQGHTLLLGVHTITGLRNGREVVMVLSLIRGPAPPCYGEVISPPVPPPNDPRLRPARPPHDPRLGPARPPHDPRLGPARPPHDPRLLPARRLALQSVPRRLALRYDRPDQWTTDQLYRMGQLLPEPLTIGSASAEYWVSYPDCFGEAKAREAVRKVIDSADLYLLDLDG